VVPLDPRMLTLHRELPRIAVPVEYNNFRIDRKLPAARRKLIAVRIHAIGAGEFLLIRSEADADPCLIRSDVAARKAEVWRSLRIEFLPELRAGPCFWEEPRAVVWRAARGIAVHFEIDVAREKIGDVVGDHHIEVD